MDGSEKYGEKNEHVGGYKSMDYDSQLYLGQRNRAHEDINFQDFIWRIDKQKQVNFVSGLYEALNNNSFKQRYTVIPNQILPTFNRKIHRKFMPFKTTVTRHTVANTECVPREGHSCTTTGM